MLSCPAGQHAKFKSASWTPHSAKPPAAKSGKHGHKSHAAASHTADSSKAQHTAAASAAGPAAAAAAAARKGKAKLANSRLGWHPGGSLLMGEGAEHHTGEDEQVAAVQVPHSRLRSKVWNSLSVAM